MGAGEFGAEILGPEEHARCLREAEELRLKNEQFGLHKHSICTSGGIWMVEKEYPKGWMPIVLGVFLHEAGAVAFMEGRKANFPAEQLRVCRYVREENSCADAKSG